MGDKTRQSLLNSQARNGGISELIVIYNYANLSWRVPDKVERIFFSMYITNRNDDSREYSLLIDWNWKNEQTDEQKKREREKENFLFIYLNSLWQNRTIQSHD